MKYETLLFNNNNTKTGLVQQNYANDLTWWKIQHDWADSDLPYQSQKVTTMVLK